MRKVGPGGASEAEVRQGPRLLLVIDCPGQVEPVTHHPSVLRCWVMQRELDLQLVAVHLVGRTTARSRSNTYLQPSSPCPRCCASSCPTSTFCPRWTCWRSTVRWSNCHYTQGARHCPCAFDFGPGLGAHEAADAGLGSPEGEREDTIRRRAGARPALGRSFRRRTRPFATRQDFRLTLVTGRSSREHRAFCGPLTRQRGTRPRRGGARGPPATWTTATRRAFARCDERAFDGFGALRWERVAVDGERGSRAHEQFPRREARRQHALQRVDMGGSRHAESPAATVVTAASGSLLSDDEWARITRVVPVSPTRRRRRECAGFVFSHQKNVCPPVPIKSP